MRILHVVPSYLPAIRYGGPIVSVHALCAGLTRRGHEVEVFTTNVDGDSVSDVPLDRPVFLDGVKIQYFPVSKLRRLYHSPTMAAALSSSIASFDLLHTHSVFLWPTWAAARAARRHEVPYVLSPRGMLVKDLLHSRSRWLKSAWIKLIEQKNIYYASGIHCTAKIETDELLSLKLPMQAKTFEVPNGVALPKLIDSGNALPAREPYVLALGRISWKKRLDLSLAAIAKVPGLHFVIAGPDDENLMPSLKQIAENLGIADRVGFVGSVSGIEKDKLLQQALALMITSVSENFGNVVLESMAAARPVLLVPQVGAADIVVAARAGSEVSPDSDSMALVLSNWLANPELANALGRNGRQFVESYYSWDTIAAQMESEYREILGL